MVAIAVIFLGRGAHVGRHHRPARPGLASAAVIAALALFLWQAARERQTEAAERLEEAERVAEAQEGTGAKTGSPPGRGC